MIQYFPEPKSPGGRIKCETDLSNYATKINLKDATGVDISSFVKKTDLSNLKSDVDRLEFNELKNIPSGLGRLKRKVNKFAVDKLVPTLVDLSELSGVVNTYVLRKTEYKELD